ncbi:YdcF family protein [Candidatus Berkelbacteria bacterium]|nr:YdcF family protein [Candidatus Berkelbacteria bacterium]
MTPQEITSYIFLEDEDPHGDLVFVFGTGNAVKPCVERVAGLYRRNAAPWFVITGGWNEKFSFVESDEISERLEHLGISAKKIIREGASSNSLENVLNAIPDVEQTVGWSQVKSIVVVTKDYHMRRALMTLRKNVPSHVQFKAAPYVNPEYGITKQNWFESEIGRERVLDEVERIKKYLAKGDIAEL